MKFQKHKLGWWALVSAGLAASLSVSGCDRSNTESDEAEVVAAKKDEPSKPVVVTKSVPIIACDDPLVQDRLKLALQTTLNQKIQGFVASYANQAQININSRVVTDRVRDVLIDVQDPTVLQTANSAGVTTCQAKVGIVLPSQDLYQANQVYAAAGRPSLQERLAANNIRLNNNMLLDDGFSYVVGKQSGEIRTRIAGQPAIIELVSDAMAGSVVQSSIEARRAKIEAKKAQIRQQRQAQELAQRQAQQQQRIRQPQPVEPVPSVQPPKPVTVPPAPAPDKSAASVASLEATEATKQAAESVNSPAPIDSSHDEAFTVPTDDSIEMVIIEDDSATY